VRRSITFIMPVVRALHAVACAFVGIRRDRRSLTDLGVRPRHIVIAAILCLLLLIGGLVSIVRWVLG